LTGNIFLPALSVLLLTVKPRPDLLSRIGRDFRQLLAGEFQKAEVVALPAERQLSGHFLSFLLVLLIVFSFLSI